MIFHHEYHQYIWYKSQVSYRILLSFLRISARQLADFREPPAESSQIICGNIAGYPRNLCTYLRRVAAERSKEIAQQFEDSQRRFHGLNNLQSPAGRSEDSHKTNPRAPKRQFHGLLKDDSAGSPQTIHEFLHRLSQKSAMDYRGSWRISISNLWHVPYE